MYIQYMITSVSDASIFLYTYKKIEIWFRIRGTVPKRYSHGLFDRIELEEKGHQWQPALMILEQAAIEA